MTKANRNCSVEVEDRWQMSFFEKGMENSLTSPVCWWLFRSITVIGGIRVNSVRASYVTTTIPHTSSTISSSPSFCSRGISAAQPPPALPSIISVLRKIRPLFESLFFVFSLLAFRSFRIVSVIPLVKSSSRFLQFPRAYTVCKTELYFIKIFWK